MAGLNAEKFEQAGELLVGLTEKISYLTVKLRDSNWASLSRLGFVREAGNCLDKMTGIRKNLEELEHVLSAEKLGINPLLSDLKKIEKLIEKNVHFEHEKKSDFVGIHPRTQEEHPELFASLQQSVLSIMLKTRFLVERSAIFVQRNAPSAEAVGEATERKEIIQLLEQKEAELQQLREQYDNVRKHTILGFAHEENAAETEQDMQKLARKFESEKRELKHRASEFRSIISGLQSEFLQLSDKLEENERAFSEYVDKSEELIMLLKKERDYSKKIVLDIENDVMQLRAKYSNELLKMEESKAKARGEATVDARKAIGKLQLELEDKEELLRHFKELAKRKEKESLELNEKLSYVNAAMKAREMDYEKKSAVTQAKKPAKNKPKKKTAKKAKKK